MTLRDLIDELEYLTLTEGELIEVVATADDNEPYTPVISVGKDKDGVRRVRLS